MFVEIDRFQLPYGLFCRENFNWVKDAGLVKKYIVLQAIGKPGNRIKYRKLTVKERRENDMKYEISNEGKHNKKLTLIK